MRGWRCSRVFGQPLESSGHRLEYRRAMMIRCSTGIRLRKRTLKACGPLLVLCAFSMLGDARAAESSASSVSTDRHVGRLLQKLCSECHGAQDPKAELRIDALDSHWATTRDAETWQDVLNRINVGEMPPPDAPQPTTEERQVLVRWLTDGLRQAAQAKRYAAGRVVVRRLTRYEYQNTMRDLLGVHLNFAAELPPEPLSPDGFLNNGAFLEMSPTQVEACLKAARIGLREAIVTGEAPTVHQFKRQVTNVGRLPGKAVAGHEPANPEFILGIDTFPRRGEFQITVRAGAVIPTGYDYPRLRLSLGCLPGIIHVPRRIVGEVDVKSPADDPETYVFHGRIEDFPQPGDVPFGNVDFNGMIALIDFMDADGQELRYPDRTYAVPPAKKKPAPKTKKGKGTSQTPGLSPEPPPLPENPRLDIVIESVEFEAPHFVTWPPPSHTEILSTDGTVAASLPDDVTRARHVLKRFMSRAFRRPVAESELAATLDLFNAFHLEGSSFEEAMRETLASVLVSPHFLYIVETREKSNGPEPDAVDVQKVNRFELATRLSYFLWSSMPDDLLFELATDGRLNQPQVIEQQVHRMLKDDRSSEFIRRFADQWFDLAALDRVAVNPEFHPGFDDDLKVHMADQARAFFAEVIRSDASCLDLLDSDWTMLNRPLAKHYGMAGPRSWEFERVSLTGNRQRGGVLGQGAFLLSNSDGEHPHPIKRAVWILDRLLASPPAPPPPDVPELDSESPDLAGLSLKEQLALHRDKESCGNCHRGIDPWGVPLEHFSAVGLWQTESAVRRNSKARGKVPRGAPVDASSVLPDGTEINGLNELKSYLRTNRRELFARSVVRRLAVYALGRSLDLGDREAVDELTTVFIDSDFRLNRLMVALVKSDLFLTK